MCGIGNKFERFRLSRAIGQIGCDRNDRCEEEGAEGEYGMYGQRFEISSERRRFAFRRDHLIDINPEYWATVLGGLENLLDGCVDFFLKRFCMNLTNP